MLVTKTGHHKTKCVEEIKNGGKKKERQTAVEVTFSNNGRQPLKTLYALSNEPQKIHETDI